MRHSNKYLLYVATLVLSAFIYAAPAEAATVDVSITPSGFSPSTVNVYVGDTVRWTNNDTQTRNVSSNDHPSHTLYSALNLGNVAQGGQLTLVTADVGTFGYHDHIFSGYTGTVVVAAAVAGGGSGGTALPTAKIVQPNGGETLNAGADYLVFWTATGNEIKSMRLTLSLDDGVTYPTVVSAAEFHDGAYVWKVPSTASTTAKMKIESLATGSVVLATDVSDAVFTIKVPATPVTTTTPAPATTPEPTPVITTTPEPTPTSATGTTGNFVPSEVLAAATDIAADKGLVAATGTPNCVAGTLIKGSSAPVYYCGKDGKRYAFPDERVYRTWYADFKGVVSISDAVLATIPLGGNVTYRPGLKMVKIATDPKTYAVAPGGVLRWVKSETVAVSLYGTRWNRMIDVVSDAFFATYSVGATIE